MMIAAKSGLKQNHTIMLYNGGKGRKNSRRFRRLHAEFIFWHAETTETGEPRSGSISVAGWKPVK